MISDLEKLSDALKRSGAEDVALDEVFPAILNLRTFGLHLARLDVRQNSPYHDKALTEIFKSKESGAVDFAKLNPADEAQEKIRIERLNA